MGLSDRPAVGMTLERSMPNNIALKEKRFQDQPIPQMMFPCIFKLFRISISLGILLACTCWLRADSEHPPRLLVPEHPRNLLLALPPVPEHWELVQSQGRSDLYGTTKLISFALRKYSIPRKDEEGRTIEPGGMEMVLTDVASEAGMRDRFMSAMEDLPADAARMPFALDEEFTGYLRQQGRAVDEYVFKGFNGGRLLLQIKFQKFSEREVRSLLGELSMDSLRLLGQSLPTEEMTSWTFPTYEVDEMQAGKDRESEITIHRPKLGSQEAPKEPLPISPLPNPAPEK